MEKIVREMSVSERIALEEITIGLLGVDIETIKRLGKNF